ncbi:MAG TPA: hypothetical protein VFF65_06175 [Phycisphaerales bacterium]|nr:hypothetical protein [Phycisphaerales bacterium]
MSTPITHATKPRARGNRFKLIPVDSWLFWSLLVVLVHALPWLSETCLRVRWAPPTDELRFFTYLSAMIFGVAGLLTAMLGLKRWIMRPYGDALAWRADSVSPLRRVFTLPGLVLVALCAANAWAVWHMRTFSHDNPWPQWCLVSVASLSMLVVKAFQFALDARDTR